MTEQELQQQRAHQWRLDGDAVRTIEQAREFIASVSFCLLYPERSLPLVSTIIGAYAGSAANLPDAKHAFADPRTEEAVILMVRLLRERSAYEMNLFGDAGLVVSAATFPYFYALVGDRNPKAAPKLRAQGASISPLARTVFEAIQKHGPLNKERTRKLVGGEASSAALDRALGELWSILKITRVDYREKEGAFWDVMYRWSPQMVKDGLNISEPEAISALLGKYLEAVIAATQEEIEQLFSHFTSRAKVRDAVNALLSARELALVAASPRTLICLAETPETPLRRRLHG
jgi:uncharacterized protein YcaQ